jgi:hypothetical protein
MGVNNLKIQTAEYMLSSVAGLGVAQSWLPQVVQQAFLQSVNDGNIQISPDPVTMISGTLNWFNASPDPQVCWVLLHRAPRAIVVQDPCTVIITDGWSFQISDNPIVVSPSVTNDWFGGKLNIDRPSVLAANLTYARYFLQADDSVSYVPIGTVPAGKSLVFSYVAGVQTPGVWTQPSSFQGEYEAFSYWTRLVLMANPVGSS